MSTQYIIVKYAELYKGKAHLNHSVFNSFTAVQLNIKTEIYNSREEAEPDLKRLQEANPSVGYGIVELDKSNRE